MDNTQTTDRHIARLLTELENHMELPKMAKYLIKRQMRFLTEDIEKTVIKNITDALQSQKKG